MQLCIDLVCSKAKKPTFKEICVFIRELRFEVARHSSILEKIPQVSSIVGLPTTEQLELLPLKTMDDFIYFEDFINVSTNYNKMVKYLSLKGGTNLIDVTRRILKSVISYPLASEFNFAGRGNKQAFRCCKSRDLVIDSVRKNNLLHDTGEKDVDQVIKSFLRYAPSKIKNNQNTSIQPSKTENKEPSIESEML